MVVCEYIMHKHLTGILGISGALVATVFGGFLIVNAAVVSYTINGASTNTFNSGESMTIALQVTSSGAESIADVTAYIHTIGSLDDIPGITNISCSDGDDYSDTSYVDCVWDAGFQGSKTISFDITIADPGTYVLAIETLTTDNDDDIAEFTITGVSASAPFTFDTAITQDLDSNGKIDAFKITFSEDVDADTAATEDVTVAGYTVTGVSAWDGDASSLKVLVTELGSYDSGAEPSVTVSGISNTDGDEVSETTKTASDKSTPVMVSGVIAEGGDFVTITFSEDINAATLNTVALNDFSLSENSIAGVSETGPGVVKLTLGTTTASTSIDVSVGGDVIDDTNGQPTEAHTIPAVLAPDTTPITIQSAGLTTSAASSDSVTVGDTVTLTFALSELAATSTISMLNNSDVSVATTGTTYTAVYTVDGDTPLGVATFGILIADEAGNESTQTATTDGSSITIVAAAGGGGGDSSIAFSVSLTAANGGMNLVSLPVLPADTSIASVLSGITSSVTSVWTYIDNVWYVYYPNNAALSNLSTMVPEYAYFIEVTEGATLSGSGTAVTKSRVYTEGWQLVGYVQPDADTTGTVSIDTAFSHIGLAGVAYSDLLELDNGLGAVPTAVDRGKGFWMNVIDLTFVPTPS